MQAGVVPVRVAHNRMVQHGAPGGTETASLAPGVTDNTSVDSDALSGIWEATRVCPAGFWSPSACGLSAPFRWVIALPAAHGGWEGMAPSPRLGGELARVHGSSRTSPGKQR